MSHNHGEKVRSGAILGTLINLVGLYPFDSDGAIKNDGIAHVAWLDAFLVVANSEVSRSRDSFVISSISKSTISKGKSILINGSE